MFSVCVFPKIEDCEGGGGGHLTCMVVLFLVNVVGIPFKERSFRQWFAQWL